MILYLDASALVKRYVADAGSTEVDALIGDANVIGTSVISRAEVSAALAKAVRVGWLLRDEAGAALQVFRTEWADIVRLQLTEAIVARADVAAWNHDLRGYDAVQLATAVYWQDTIGDPITLATFDRHLWREAPRAGLLVWPDELEPYPSL